MCGRHPRPKRSRNAQPPAGIGTRTLLASRGTNTPRFEYRLLGPVEATHDGRSLALGGGKARALLARLLFDANRAVGVDRLVDELWPGEPPRSASHAVQVYVSELRRVGIDAIERRGSGYLLRRDGDALDADRFESLVAQGLEAQREERHDRASSLLREALALWRGDPLGGVPGDLLADDRRRLEELRLAAVEARIDSDLALGRDRAVVSELEALVAREPLRERFREQLVLALYRGGRQADALRAYREARATLVEELGVEPGRGLRDLHRAILVHDPALERDAAAAPPERGLLPARARPPVGREHELAELTELLGRSRLVTLTGPGGCGKTTLAVAVARAVDPAARLVELAPLENDELVAREALASVGRAPAADREPLDALVEHLRSRSLLIVLDNCEHLRDACAALASTLLDACPRVRLVATSREPLGVEAETAWSVPPLLTPEAERRPTLEQLPQFGGVRLFLERAGFELTDDNSGPVVTVCRATGGLPLAIELAAGRVTELGLEGVASQLGRQLELLVSQAAGRHGSIERAIDWTVRLLPGPERELFARLSVFSGSWTREAAAAVCRGAGGSQAVRDGIDRLVARSLVSVDSRSGRYGMLEPIRQFAARLLDSGRAAQRTRRRHAEHLAALAEQLGGAIPGPSAGAAEQRAVLELDNLRSALAWAEAGAPALYVRIAAALWFFFGDDYPREGRAHCERALALPDGSRPGTRAWLLNGLALAGWTLGDFAAAAAAARDAAALAARCGEFRAAGCALTTLGSAERDRGRFARARNLHERARRMFELAGDAWGCARSTFSLGLVAQFEGEPGPARRLLERSVEQFEQVGDDYGVGHALHALGRIALVEGALDQAEALLEEALVRQRASGAQNRESLASLIVEIAVVRGRLGDGALAADLLRESIAVYDGVGVPPSVLLHALTELAAVECALGRVEAAATVLGAVSAAGAKLGQRLTAETRESYERAVAAVRDGGRSTAKAWRDGAAASLDEAIAFALRGKA